MSFGFKILLEGEYALFSRPEFKVERVSYDVPTVSAIEGIIKSIYWKPAIKIIVDKIIVFNPINFINIRRNEVDSKISYNIVKSQINGKGNPEIFTSEKRTQRAGMILKNVKYGVEFHFELTGIKSNHEDEGEEKHYNIMLRRLKNGQCFRQPCFGCREFSVKKIELIDSFDYSQIHESLKGDTDLGYMLYGLKFKDGGMPINGDWDNPKFSDNADAMYFRPHMIDGIIDINKYREEIIC